ncbi:hypothetical protein COCCADRAFT_7571 [Bipolaris zeicola 26-R-13]|uniref:Uncharacterized protein n=1 Tax=Cochliobolus carbonum (strain 26-R-13) TaxID=930089 RepID=W6XYK1_COCC2|nr:uncharacterized protein COCCADRAFT_7571 [Bipolaris zeicola 26-R-13]EUC30375.1 hypothetical protein COCCADRAFT_7571 [Bipolaris zeicola 26-R-13]
MHKHFDFSLDFTECAIVDVHTLSRIFPGETRQKPPIPNARTARRHFHSFPSPNRRVGHFGATYRTEFRLSLSRSNGRTIVTGRMVRVVPPANPALPYRCRSGIFHHTNTQQHGHGLGIEGDRRKLGASQTIQHPTQWITTQLPSSPKVDHLVEIAPTTK